MSEILPWLWLVALLAGSAFCSGTETALFSLDHDERARAGSRARLLLKDPRELLVSILLSNLLINLLFFASAPGVIIATGLADGVLAGFLSLLAILIVGEILPKTIALRSPLLIVRLTVLPTTFIVRLLAPVRSVVNVVHDLALRAMGDAANPESGMTSEGLAQVLDRSAHEGLIEHGEADLLAEILELSSLRVREIMTPRVDVLAVDIEDDAEERAKDVREALAARIQLLPVIRGSHDKVVGCVSLRDILAYPDRALEKMVMPAMFIPEVASVMSLLEAFRRDRASEAIVVDEWGGTAGIVTIEDIFEELVGELRTEGEDVEKLVVPLGEGRFRVSGGLSIRDWNEAFGARVVPTEFETVAGLVIAACGRLPRQGEHLSLGGRLACIVHEVRNRRVQTVDIFVVAVQAEGAAS